MFNRDFYPTPTELIQEMLHGYDIEGKIILEPSAGKGNIVDQLQDAKEILACEIEPELVKILNTKCKVIDNDFFNVDSTQISHIDMIVMNPPFTRDEDHILHAWNIAPPCCDIIALCNLNTIHKPTYQNRKQLGLIIREHGNYIEKRNSFADAERKTNVDVAIIKLKKPAEDYSNEFEGFFMDEEEEGQQEGIVSYNFIRDVVNRYVEAVKLFDKQLALGVQMNSLISGFYSSELAFSVTEEQKPKTRNDFKKDLQKSAWKFIFDKMKMDKYTTKGLKEDINKFVETQENIPFTMKNIFRMIEIIIATNEERMDKAILEVFDKLTKHYHDNRYNLEGWKTNSHYILNQKFIIPFMTEANWSRGMHIRYGRTGNVEMIEDMCKALCWLTGQNYDNFIPLDQFVNRTPKPQSEWENEWQQEYETRDWNTWYDWGLFWVKGFKKGTCHFKFKDESVWYKFNQRVSKIKGFPLPEKI